MTEFNLPELPIESLELPTQEDTIKNEDGGAVDFAIVGSGQCGGRIAKAFHDAGVKKVIAINSADQDLSLLDLPAAQKVWLKSESSGAAKDMNVGRKLATESHQQIFDQMRRVFGNCAHVLISVGVGGGTGSGSLLPLVNNAKRYIEFIKKGDPNKCVGAIVVLPTEGEMKSKLVRDNAKAVLAEVGKLAQAREISPLLVIDNERIQKLYRNLSMTDFWPTINTTLAGLFTVFNRLCNLNSEFTSFDPADYRSVIQCGGCCVMGMTRINKIEDETTVSNALATNMERTLLSGGFDYTTAKYAGCIAVGGQAVMQQPGIADMLSYGFDTLNNLVGGATCHRGIYQDPRPENAAVLKVYTIIGGLDVPLNIV